MDRIVNLGLTAVLVILLAVGAYSAVREKIFPPAPEMVALSDDVVVEKADILHVDAAKEAPAKFEWVDETLKEIFPSAFAASAGPPPAFEVQAYRKPASVSDFSPSQELRDKCAMFPDDVYPLLQVLSRLVVNNFNPAHEYYSNAMFFVRQADGPVRAIANVTVFDGRANVFDWDVHHPDAPPHGILCYLGTK